MLYKLRNNAFASINKENNRSDFAYLRTGFLSDSAYAEVLSHEPQELITIAEKIGTSTVISVEDTLKILEDYGFVISGNTEEELAKKEIPLYRNIILK